jgi:CHAT domain-containing protein
VLPGAVFFDRDFSVARFKQLLQQSYPVMHIASHFVFNPGTEASSYLVMGDGSKLSLQQLREDDFDFGDVDLITLSACETAVGGG